MTERLLLLDGHSLAYRAFFGLPVDNFKTAEGQVTNAVYGFTSMLLSTLEQFEPSHVAVAFDVNRHTFRREQFPAYKAQRAPTPPEFAGQTELIMQVLDVLGIPHASKEGYEADDIIATWASEAAATGARVKILTGDRDSLQLVTEFVTVLSPRKGVSDLVEMTPQAVFEKYGVTPAQYADVAALRGDSSDNLPGVPGVGEKTAATWLSTYGDLRNLISHADELRGKVGEALRANAAQVLLNRQLTELVRNVPDIPSWHALHRASTSVTALHELFDVLQFRALRPRALRWIGSEADAPVLTTQPAATVGSDRSAALALIGRHERLALAWDAEKASAGTVGLAGTPEQAIVVDFDEEVATALAMHPSLVGHDVKRLVRAYPLIRGWVADTAIMSYLANPGVRATDLAECAQRLLGLEVQGSASSLFDSDESVSNLGQEAVLILALESHLQPLLEREGATRLLTEVEMPLTLLLADMERRGIGADSEQLRALELEFGARMLAEESAAVAIAGRPFNLASPKQLQELLFAERGLPKTKRTKTGYTTDAEALQSLLERTGDPLLQHLLNWREVSKLRQTVSGLLPQIDQQGRIHTTFQQTVAATGRLASTDPNLQNIPVRTAEGRRIRSAFVPGQGYDVLLTADYSQIEMRIMAHLSGDERLIEAFHSGEDLHTTVASQVFGVEPEAVDPDMRRRIKAMSYGLAYGLSAYGLAQQLAIDTNEAQRLMSSYFERFGSVRDYLRDTVETARATGYTETMFGRRRYLPDLTSDQRVRRELAERAALNAPIQGSAADIIKLAMLRVESALQGRGTASRLLLQVHDELVLECPRDEVHEVSNIVQQEMAAAASLRVPLEVSVGVGANWEAAAH